MRNTIPQDTTNQTQPVRRPMFADDYEKYEWLMDHPKEVSQADKDWLAWYLATSEWKDIYGHLQMGRYSRKEADSVMGISP
jgi:hypothetical protein